MTFDEKLVRLKHVEEEIKEIKDGPYYLKSFETMDDLEALLGEKDWLEDELEKDVE